MNPVVKNKDSVKKTDYERWIEFAKLEFTSWLYVNRTEMAQQNAPFKRDGKVGGGIIPFSCFFLC